MGFSKFPQNIEEWETFVLLENMILEYTSHLTRMVIAAWSHLHVSSPIYNNHNWTWHM